MLAITCSIFSDNAFNAKVSKSEKDCPRPQGVLNTHQFTAVCIRIQTLEVRLQGNGDGKKL